VVEALPAPAVSFVVVALDVAFAVPLSKVSLVALPAALLSPAVSFVAG
jgi:hypothetical protein